MNSNMKKWVEALRSGKYEQGYNQLRENDTFCCLGVACDLYMKETGKGKWDQGYWFFDVEKEDPDNLSSLPSKVQKWLGLSTKTGEFYNSEGGKTSLADLNDSRQLNFEQIANVIETTDFI